MAGEGDHLLKQFGSSVDWEDSSLITDLYTLYLGTVVTPGKRPHPEASDLKDNRSPAALRLRLRLVPFLTKSTLAANSFPSAVQVSKGSLKVFKGLQKYYEGGGGGGEFLRGRM